MKARRRQSPAQKFVIDDCALPAGRMPRMVRRIIDYLDRLPLGAMRTTKVLARQLGVSAANLYGFATWPDLSAYRATESHSKGRTLWGNTETIRAWHEQYP